METNSTSDVEVNIYELIDFSKANMSKLKNKVDFGEISWEFKNEPYE